MGKKSKRLTAAERLNLLLESPDLQNLSARWELTPAKLTQQLRQQIDEDTSELNRSLEAQEKALDKLFEELAPLIKAQVETKDEQSRKALQKEIDGRIAQHVPSNDVSGEGAKGLIDSFNEWRMAEVEERARAAMAVSAIDGSFLASRYEKAIDAAFVAFKLDRTNPISWRVLLGLLAWTHFDEPRKKGRPPDWSPERYCLLLQHIDRIKARHPGRLSGLRACELLKKSEFKAEWQDQSAKRLDGALAEARDPFRNRALAQLVYDEGRGIIEAAITSGIAMSVQDEAALIKKLGRKHADEIGGRWRVNTSH